jgi:uncharacterized protein
MSTDDTKGNDLDSVIEYPCEFPIKAMGISGDALQAAVMEIINRHVPDLATDALKSRPSSNGKYTAITITITAQNRAQLDAIYEDLSAHKLILMAL